MLVADYYRGDGDGEGRLLDSEKGSGSSGGGSLLPREEGREGEGEAGREAGARGCTESQECYCQFTTEVTEMGKASCFVGGEGGGRSSGGGSLLPRGREGGRRFSLRRLALLRPQKARSEGKKVCEDTGSAGDNSTARRGPHRRCGQWVLPPLRN